MDDNSQSVSDESSFRWCLYQVIIQFKADRLQMIVVAKKYICVATVHQ